MNNDSQNFKKEELPLQKNELDSEPNKLEETLDMGEAIDLDKELEELKNLLGQDFENQTFEKEETEEIDIESLLEESKNFDYDSLLEDAPKFDRESSLPIDSPSENMVAKEQKNELEELQKNFLQEDPLIVELKQIMNRENIFEEDSSTNILPNSDLSLSSTISPFDILNISKEISDSLNSDLTFAKDSEDEIQEILSKILEKSSSSFSELEQSFSNSDSNSDLDPMSLPLHQEAKKEEPKYEKDEKFGIEFAEIEPDLGLTVTHAETEQLRKVLKSETTEENKKPSKKAKEVPAQAPKEFLAAQTESDEGDPYLQKENDQEDVESFLAIVDTNQKKVRKFVLFFLFLISIGIGLSGTYLYYKNKFAVQKIVCAQGLADISMGLLKSKFEQKSDVFTQNLSLETTQKLLQDLLPYPYQILSPINDLNSLNFTGYQTQILFFEPSYEFILVARPIDSIVNRFVFKPSLLIDSKNMLLYQIDHNHKVEEYIEAWKKMDEQKELTKIDLPKNRMIPLQELNQGNVEMGFMPPLELFEKSLEASNYLYNAPKYHQISAKIIQLASRLEKSVSYQNDQEQLDKCIRLLSDYPFFTLYSAEGITTAISAQKQIENLFPYSGLILGYLEFDKANGRIQQAKIINPSFSSDPAKENSNKIISNAFTAPIENEIALPSLESTSDQNPFVKKLLIQAKKRKETLAVLSKKIANLIKDNDSISVSKFKEQYEKLNKEYQDCYAIENERLAKYMADLYFSLKDSPVKEKQAFFVAIKELHLKNFLTEELKKAELRLQEELLDSLQGSDEEREKWMTNLIEQIPFIYDLSELDSVVNRLVKQLDANEGKGSVTKSNLALKKQMQTAILSQIGKIILSPQNAGMSHLLKEFQRNTLEKILKNAGVNVEKERDFYLQEFDLLLQQMRHQPSFKSLENFGKIERTLGQNIDADENLTVEQKEAAKRNFADSLKNIGDKQKEHLRMQDEINQFSLKSLINLTMEEQLQSNVRIAQQMIFGTDVSKNALQRQDVLKQAIELLYPAAEIDRNLWKDILEARYLLIKSFESYLKKMFDSKLELNMQQKSPLFSIKTLLEKYVDAKYKITATSVYSHQYDMQVKAFMSDEAIVLDQAIHLASKVEKQIYKTQTTIERYSLSLKALLQDQQKSCQAGFFIRTKADHYLILSRIQYKLRLLERLQKDANSRFEAIFETIEQYKDLIQKEKIRMQTSESITPASVSLLQQNLNNLSLPDFSAEDFSQKFQKLLSIQVSSDYD